MILQDALHLLYPPQCVLCDERVTTDFGLCATCRRETPFIGGLVCDKCGTPLLGEADSHVACCDECMVNERPWSKGRAAIAYAENGRKLALALKHGDRMDLARPAAQWMLNAAKSIVTPEMLVVPIPLHWTRLFKRRFNQSALLGRAFAKLARLDHCPDLLLRVRATPSQENRNQEARFANLDRALTINPRHQRMVRDRHILLIDDVMTSGATFGAATLACLGAGARDVTVLALTRVQKAP
jgi:ComF family protein